MFELSEFTEKFKHREGFGVIGVYLDTITGYLNERMPDGYVRIEVPYHGFNVRGKVSDVHRDVHGVMPRTYLYGNRAEVVKENDTTTLFYGDDKVGFGNFIPFLSECDVYFVSEASMDGEGLIVKLEKAPSWREYL